jgi:hypothetical protein
MWVETPDFSILILFLILPTRAHGHNARRQRTVEFPPTPLLRPAHRDETREQPVTTAPASCTWTDARSSFPSEFTPGALREFD